MDTVTAREVMIKVSELIELSSIFQARYGRDYRLVPGSPDEAWELYQAISDQQTAIARLLDLTALENPIRRCAQWWKSQDVINSSVVSMMAQEAAHLIACCASFETQPRAVASPVIDVSQSVIAGMLHPSCVLVAQGDTGTTRRAS